MKTKQMSDVSTMALMASIAGGCTGGAVVSLLWAMDGPIDDREVGLCFVAALAILAWYFWMMVWGGIKGERNKQRLTQLLEGAVIPSDPKVQAELLRNYDRQVASQKRKQAAD